VNKLIGLELPEYTYNKHQTAIIIGAGLAGCAIANALASRGYRCKLYDRNADIASLTSALPVATISPTTTAEPLQAKYFDHAFEVCRNALPATLFNQCGALQLTEATNTSAESSHAMPCSALEAYPPKTNRIRLAVNLSNSKCNR